jgi:two-component system, LuxR family, sensor histidine kinase TtrS
MTVSAIATLRNKVGDAETSSFGGVVFARADNEEIQSIDDLTNRVVIASSVYEMGSGPMQWEEMRVAGQDLLFAPSQASTRSYYIHPYLLEIF